MKKEERVYQSVTEMIGYTPLIKINKVYQGKAKLFAKCDYMNPGGSVKDRIGISIIKEAEEKGLLTEGSTIIEATSGNTGIGLILAGLNKNYRYIFVMPDKMSEEKRNLLRAYGAEVIIVPSAVPPHHPEHYNNKAKQLAKEIPQSFLANQFYNQANPKAHYETTGPEIWAQTDGKITHFVCGMGTGGTMSGVGRYLKSKNPNIKIIGADPYGSIIKTYKESGKMTQGSSYLVEGIGEDQIPETLHIDYLDDVYNVSDKESFNFARSLARNEGLFVGSSSGTIGFVASKIAQNLSENDLVVFMACDHGDRYLSKMYNDEWMRLNQFLSMDDITVQRVLDTKKSNFKQLLSVEAKAYLEDAFKLMNNHGITQVPVIEEGKNLGSLKETDIMRLILQDRENLKKRVREVMTEAFPLVKNNQRISDCRDLFKKHESILVQNSVNELIGLISRADYIEFTI